MSNTARPSTPAAQTQKPTAPIPETPPDTYTLSTKQFSKRYLVEPATVRRSFCVNGHYMGIVPIKLPNRRLAWPQDGPAQQ